MVEGVLARYSQKRPTRRALNEYVTRHACPAAMIGYLKGTRSKVLGFHGTAVLIGYKPFSQGAWEKVLGANSWTYCNDVRRGRGVPRHAWPGGTDRVLKGYSEHGPSP